MKPREAWNQSVSATFRLMGRDLLDRFSRFGAL
jgi:hypothetical protein